MRKIQRITAALLAAICLQAGVVTASAEGSAPIAENLELRTYRNVSVGGRLSAFDAEDDVVSYTITTEPVKGSIELEENGCFVYTPKENKRGRDYFGYKAVDSEGNLSQEATVIIRIERQKKSVMYTDLEGMGCEYAAVLLAEEGIFTGEQIGGSFCFQPDKSVTRGEFLSLCMLLKGNTPLLLAARSGYADDDSIPAWVKGYCAAAQLAQAAPRTDRLEAQKPITASEAAAWLDRALGLAGIRYLQPDDTHTQACLNLSAHGIPTNTGSQDLTRAEAARMLAAALELINR